MIRYAVALLAVTAMARAQQEWCSTKCGKQHTRCRFQDDTPASRCGKVNQDHYLNAQEKQTIVKKHNDLRAEVTKGDGACLPPATNMQIMSWDTELESIAKRWAMQCDFNHDPCRLRLNGGTVGQNLWTSWTTSSNFDREAYLGGIQAWYDEKEYFSPTLISKFATPKHLPKGIMIGHYTQLVWAESDKIGCERISYSGGNQLLVCDYGPAGNFLGSPVYIMKEGVNISSCPIAHGVLARGQVSHLVFALSLGLSAAGYLGLRLTF